MNAEKLAEIRDRKVPLGPDAVWTLAADRDALLAEVERLTTDAAKATRWEIRLAETLHHAQLNEGDLSAEVERLKAERDRIREILATMRTGKPADLAAGVGRIAAIVNGGEPC